MMNLESLIRKMPKVELHVHLEGSIRPATLLKLAKRNQVPLPAQDAEGLARWYQFTDFSHFIQVYKTIGKCLRTPDDIELVTREFLQGQAEQCIYHTEATYTAYSQYLYHRIPFRDQLAAINRARRWAKETLGVSMTLTIDISREISAEEGMLIADWAIGGLGEGVTGFGLGGPEAGNPPEKFAKAFDKALRAGLHSVPHAGEICGAESIWGALRELKAERIGHGVRCLEDEALVEELRKRQIPLEVCPTSNVCLKVVGSFEEHPFRRLLDAGLTVTLNSDDPPLFNTSLTDEFLKAAFTFQLSVDQLKSLVFTALGASFLPEDEKKSMGSFFEAKFTELTQPGDL